ncbi:MAG TPA: hypothetical protein VK308_14375, partial [Pyrinomonadaceae bacterium]|nr:hypothetical protein [Pyrinomonadaceae bacterium]
MISAQHKNTQKASIVELNSVAPRIEHPATELETFSQITANDSAAAVSDENNRQSDAPEKPVTNEFKYNFHSIESSKNPLESDERTNGNLKKFSFQPELPPTDFPVAANNEPASDIKIEHFHWRAA